MYKQMNFRILINLTTQIITNLMWQEDERSRKSLVGRKKVNQEKLTWPWDILCWRCCYCERRIVLKPFFQSSYWRESVSVHYVAHKALWQNVSKFLLQCNFICALEWNSGCKIICAGALVFFPFEGHWPFSKCILKVSFNTPFDRRFR